VVLPDRLQNPFGKLMPTYIELVVFQPLRAEGRAVLFFSLKLGSPLLDKLGQGRRILGVEIWRTSLAAFIALCVYLKPTGPRDLGSILSVTY
jgi:hypothetical protein